MTPSSNAAPAAPIAIQPSFEFPPEPTPRTDHRPTAHRKRSRPFSRRVSTALARHSRKCAVCKHKDRADIEQDFLHWHSASTIASDFDLEYSAIYRHAHATGLFNERLTNIRYAAVHIAEQAESVQPTAGDVLKAVRACTLIDDEGKWIDPPKRVIVEHRHVTAAEAEKIAKSTPEPAVSNRNFQKSETGATPTKQTPAPESNRNFRSTKTAQTPTVRATPVLTNADGSSP
jgi:hypothetical protein